MVRDSHRGGTAEETPLQHLQNGRFHVDDFSCRVTPMTDAYQNIGIDRGELVGLLGGEEERCYGDELIDGRISFGLGHLGMDLVVIVVGCGGHESIDVGHGHGDALSMELEVVDAVVEPLDNLGA